MPPGEASTDPGPAVDPLVDEAVKKSGLVWVGPASGASPARPVWQVWQGGCIYLLCGGLEQPAPVHAGETAIVVVRSKDKWTRLVSFEATVERVESGDEWESLAAVMLTKRLNLPDGDGALQRWARECEMLRLRPGRIVESPGAYESESHAAPPPVTTAGTKVPRPWHLFGRPSRRR